MNKIIQLAQDSFPYLKTTRRDFHQHPELGFQEKYTSSRIREELGKMNIQYESGIGETGIVALIPGKQPGKTIMLRFDMDALPITEKNVVDYASLNEGVMHACGHDGHMAIGLTTAKILSGLPDDLAGKIMIVFQPAEEGMGGAERMIKEGLLEKYRPDFALGMHIWNEKPLGWFGISPGPIMAGADFFEIQITGKGGHGALPENTKDPILTSAQMITALQSIVSRNISPKDTAVVSITQINGGETYNVIPGEVLLKGTIRTFNKTTRAKIVERLEEIVAGVSKAMDCEAFVKFIMTDPPTINDEQIVKKMILAAREIFPDSIIDEKYQSMGSEDMAYFLEKIPGCYIYVGSRNEEKGFFQGHHHPEFDFDEEVLSKSTALMIAGVMELQKS